MNKKKAELVFENLLWNSRLFTLFAVIFGTVGSVILFGIASYDIWHIACRTFEVFTSGVHPEHFHEEVVGAIIGAVDLYLMAVVMLIFGFGLYELFVSKIEPAERKRSSKILEIRSLDQLKDKLAKVIVMVLVVSFFKKILNTSFDGPLEMLYFAASILALSLGLYFLRKGEHFSGE